MDMGLDAPESSSKPGDELLPDDPDDPDKVKVTDVVVETLPALSLPPKFQFPIPSFRLSTTTHHFPGVGMTQTPTRVRLGKPRSAL